MSNSEFDEQLSIPEHLQNKNWSKRPKKRSKPKIPKREQPSPSDTVVDERATQEVLPEAEKTGPRDHSIDWTDISIGNMIIGPSQTGKTTYVGMLTSNLTTDQTVNGYQCHIVPINDHMRKFIENAAFMISKGEAPSSATREVTPYSFQFKYHKTDRNRFASFVKPKEKVDHYLFLDGPGEVLFPTRDESKTPEFEKQRTLLIKQAKNTRGLIMCVDSHNVERASAFFRSLSSILHDVGDPLPFERVAILLTKADSYFHGYGRKAYQQAKESDPIPQLESLIGSQNLTMLQKSLNPSAQLACGWVSIFGFIPNEGTANYDPHSENVRVHHSSLPPAVFQRLWKPFRVLDPLLFLSTGQLGTLRPIK